ncbi:hypothetical protein [Paracoccus endophyticus]|uniref:hypothetical protein n=1 Tax=Paracoccus endophyticus TaxID=2233774 RepID=UPI0013A689CE|nr:hypothetical protein [Paracoccus endophyticus]
MALSQYTDTVEQLTLNFISTDLESDSGQVVPGILVTRCIHKGTVISLDAQGLQWPGELDIEAVAAELLEYLGTCDR